MSKSRSSIGPRAQSYRLTMLGLHVARASLAIVWQSWPQHCSRVCTHDNVHNLGELVNFVKPISLANLGNRVCLPHLPSLANGAHMAIMVNLANLNRFVSAGEYG